MSFQIILFLIFIVIPTLFVFWIFSLVKLYRKGKAKRKLFYVQAILLSTILIAISWQLHTFPLSRNFYINEQAAKITGKSFWSWKEFSYDDGVDFRGEGYTLDIYKFNNDMAAYFVNPSDEFFKDFPPQKLSSIRWTKTPIKEEEQSILEFVTPVYGGWKGEIVERQDFIREIATKEGAYYAYQRDNTNFYLIVPKKRLFIMIYHNM